MAPNCKLSMKIYTFRENIENFYGHNIWHNSNLHPNDYEMPDWRSCNLCKIWKLWQWKILKLMPKEMLENKKYQFG